MTTEATQLGSEIPDPRKLEPDYYEVVDYVNDVDSMIPEVAGRLEDRGWIQDHPETPEGLCLTEACRQVTREGVEEAKDIDAYDEAAVDPFAREAQEVLQRELVSRIGHEWIVGNTGAYYEDPQDHTEELRSEAFSEWLTVLDAGELDALLQGWNDHHTTDYEDVEALLSGQYEYTRPETKYPLTSAQCVNYTPAPGESIYSETDWVSAQGEDTDELLHTVGVWARMSPDYGVHLLVMRACGHAIMQAPGYDVTRQSDNRHLVDQLAHYVLCSLLERVGPAFYGEESSGDTDIDADDWTEYLHGLSMVEAYEMVGTWVQIVDPEEQAKTLHRDWMPEPKKPVEQIPGQTSLGLDS